MGLPTAGDVLQASIWGAFAALVLSAMWLDARHYRIPNWISLGLVVLFLPMVGLIAALPDGTHVLAALAVFVVAAAAFFAGLFGGGDVKFLAAVALWAGGAKLPLLLLIMAGLGGVLGLVTLATGWLMVAAPPLAARLPLGALRRWAGEGRVPYGLAIGAAALVAVPEWVIL